MQNVLSALAVLLILGVGTSVQAETRDGAVTLKATTATAGTGGAADEAAPGKDTAGFTCYDEDGDTFCACTSLKDCNALIKSGKCNGDLTIHEEDPPDATCETDSADRPGEPSPMKLKAEASTSSASMSATEMTLKAAGPGGTEFECEYDDEGNKTGCKCGSTKDCLHMFKKKACGDWDVDDQGTKASCGP
ncbi:MAG: hypothetical protein ACE363_10605 [Alphaproteobacteria bacterium]